MKSGKFSITGLGILVLALVLTTPTVASMSDGSIYNESFTGGTFDDTQSALGGGAAASISEGQEALEVTNYPGLDGWLVATLDTPVSGGTELVIESVVSVTQGGEISHHAYIMQPRRADEEPVALTIKGYEVDATHWDLDIWSTDYATGSVRAGLTLDKAISGEVIYYTVSQRILPGGEQAEVYLNDVLVGTYACNRPGDDIVSIRVGNGHPDYGFYNAYFSDVRVGPAGAPGPSLNLSDNSIFYETFNGGAFSETGSAFDGNGVSFNDNAAMFVNYDYNAGEYSGDVGTVSANSEYVVEVKVRISSDWPITENAYVMNMLSPDLAWEVNLKLEAKEKGPGDPNMWDLEIADADGTTMAGLTLTKNEYHYVAQHHLGNDGNDVDLYVDGELVGSYPDRDKTQDLGRVVVGNVSGAAGVGFGTAWVDSVSVGNLVGPPQCGDPGTVYLQSDLNRDCQVNLPDLAIFAGEWFYCTDPADPNCDQYLPLASP